MRGPGPGVPGLGAAVPAGPGAHGVYVPRGDGPADHLAGRALRTFPGAFTVAAHLAQVSPGGPPGGALWWAGQRVTAAQFAGVVGRLPGYREARALNGGQPPVLVLVICEAAAAGARSFAAAVDRLYPGPVVAATSALLQPADGAGDVVAQDGGGFVYVGEGGGGLGGELTGAMAGLAGRRDPPVPVVAVTPPQDAYQLFVQLGPDVVYAGAAGAGNAAAAAGLGWLGAAKAAKVAAEGFAGRPPAVGGRVRRGGVGGPRGRAGGARGGVVPGARGPA